MVLGARGKGIANRRCRGVVSCDEPGAPVGSIVSERGRSAKVPGSGGRVARAFRLGTACFCADAQSLTDPGAKDEAAEPLGGLGEGGRSDQGRGIGRMVGAARGLGSGRSDVRGSASRRAAVGRGGPTGGADVLGGGAGGEAVWAGPGK